MQLLIFYLNVCVRSVTIGDNVKYGGGEIKGASAMQRDDEIGDLVQHTYTVSIVFVCIHGTLTL